MVADLTKASCQLDVMYRNLDSTGASALFNLATFPGAGMNTFAYNAKVSEYFGLVPWVHRALKKLVTAVMVIYITECNWAPKVHQISQHIVHVHTPTPLSYTTPPPLRYPTAACSSWTYPDAP